MKRLLLLPVLGLLAGIASGQSVRLTSYVDPFIGTGGHGHTYPGPTLPFGMVQLSPDNGTQGWDWCSGYHYSDKVITGFSHTHLSGTGIGDLADISVLPMVGVAPDTLVYKSAFSHNRETATPGYYQVYLSDYQINAELTTTQRCGMHRYTFEKAGPAMIKVDLGWAINWDRAVDCQWKQIDATTFVGYRKSTGWAKKQSVFFALRLSKPVKSVALFQNKVRVAVKEATGAKVLAFLEFDAAAGEQVGMKVGLSFATEAGAIAALNEIPHWDFSVIKQSAENIWEKELSKIRLETKDIAVLRKFYTALYHTYQAPVMFSDAQGQYKGADQQIHKTTTAAYSVHSLWDTFRGANPLQTVTQPAIVPSIINSYLDFYKQTGLLPVWDLHFNETNTMTGYHAVPVIADAILKNIKGFDYALAYKAMKASAMQNVRATDEYRKYGYVPQDKHGFSVTMTLEYAYDDWCIAQVAKKLGNNADYQLFTQRAAGYRNLFDEKSGFFRAKNSDGKWVEPFDSYYSEHGEKAMYIEGTAWQHTFFVPHAVNEYAQLLGGKAKLEEKLDTLFTTTSAMKGENVSSDISGMIGQYAHGNEPSHHIAYMYAALGKPHKTAERVRQICEIMYSDRPDGLSGNEDCGQMSAWYVWSAMGMYPMNASSGQYVFGSPLADKVTITLPGGKYMRITIKNNSPANKYIASVKLNGKLLNTHYITHTQLMAGGEMVMEMTGSPALGVK